MSEENEKAVYPSYYVIPDAMDDGSHAVCGFHFGGGHEHIQVGTASELEEADRLVGYANLGLLMSQMFGADSGFVSDRSLVAQAIKLVGQMKANLAELAKTQERTIQLVT